jgi:formylglycine-generating enzyme required for sulfatase activity
VKRDGFETVTKSYAADELAKLGYKVPIALAPVIKYNDITLQVTPADAQLSVAGAAKTLKDGAYTHKLKEGDALPVEIKREGFVSFSKSYSADELTKAANKITVSLEKEKPQLPASLVVKPGAELDRDVQYPVHALSSTLGDAEPMEFVLVKPGTYKFGVDSNRRTRNELPERTVKIEQPFYVAIHETTNAQYQKFFEAEGESRAGTRWQSAAEKWAKAAAKWPEPLELDPLKNHLPVTNVANDEAEAFCRWVGGRLPTEAEWESAVRGLQDKGFPFPWGNAEPSAENCRIFLFSAPHLGPVPVEQFEKFASPLGLLNAMGNAAELCQDSENTRNFVLRGGSFTAANTDDLRVTWRGHGEARGEEFVGFRVVVPLGDGKPNL